MPRPKKTAAEREAARARILDIAYEILLADGPEAISTRAIAERMGVAHMALYAHFKSLAELLRALGERELAKWRDRQTAIEQAVGSGNLIEVVEATLRFFGVFARENPNVYRLAWVMPELGGETLEQNRQRLQMTVAHLAALLARGMDEGIFARRDPFLTAATVLGMVNMPYILFQSGKMIDPVMRDRMAEQVFLAAIDYLKRPE